MIQTLIGPDEMQDAYDLLVRNWAGEYPPSREVFTEAVTRGNASPIGVAQNILSGYWPK